LHITVGPTGNTVTGNVFDVNPKSFEKLLKDYDELLYIKWNPKKKDGMGCWEIRRRPDRKTAVHAGTYQGQDIYELKYVEYKLIHHVLDVPSLGYDTLAYLKSIDTFNEKDWVGNFNYTSDRKIAEAKAKANAELRYNISQFKKEFSAWRAELASGANPHHILRNWGR
jgi:hypothetical protein